MIPIKMLDPDDEQNEMNDDSARKYLKACKSVEYMRVDGRPGLTLHRGPCRFWTAIIVAPNVVQLGFLFINKHFYFYSQT